MLHKIGQQSENPIPLDPKTQRFLIRGNLRQSFQTSRKQANINFRLPLQIRLHYHLEDLYESFQFLRFVSQNQANYSQQQVAENLHELCQQMVSKISQFYTSNINSTDNDNHIEQLVQEIYFLRKKLNDIESSPHHTASLDLLSNEDYSQNIDPNIQSNTTEKLKSKIHSSNQQVSIPQFTMGKQISAFPENDEGQLSEEAIDIDKLLCDFEEVKQILFTVFGYLLKVLLARYHSQQVNQCIKQLRQVYQKSQGSALGDNEILLNLLNLLIEQLRPVINSYIEILK